jgi:hypothetical protein
MATTDWVLVRFQAGLALLTGVVTVLCTVALAFIFNRRIERLKAEFETHQAIRGERKEIFYEVLGVLGRMRYAIDEFSRSLGSPALQQHAAKMDELRAELYRLAPTAFMVLGSVGSRRSRRIGRLPSRCSARTRAIQSAGRRRGRPSKTLSKN